MIAKFLSFCILIHTVCADLKPGTSYVNDGVSRVLLNAQTPITQGQFESVAFYVHPGISQDLSFQVQLWELIGGYEFVLTYSQDVSVPANFNMGLGGVYEVKVTTVTKISAQSRFGIGLPYGSCPISYTADRSVILAEARARVSTPGESLVFGGSFPASFSYLIGTSVDPPSPNQIPSDSNRNNLVDARAREGSATTLGNKVISRLTFIEGMEAQRCFVDGRIKIRENFIVTSVDMYIHTGVVTENEVRIQIWETSTTTSLTFTLVWEYTVEVPAYWPSSTGAGASFPVSIPKESRYTIPDNTKEYYLGWTYIRNGPISFSNEANYPLFWHKYSRSQPPSVGTEIVFDRDIALMRTSIAVSVARAAPDPNKMKVGVPGPIGPQGIAGPPGPPGPPGIFVDGCGSYHNCQHKCVPYLNAAGYICACNKGWFLNVDEKTCSDLDECSEENGRCEQTCTNIPGSVICSCREGFQISPDMHECEDIDECLATDCEGICVNTIGSFHCLRLYGIHPHPDQFPGLEGLIGLNPNSTKDSGYSSIVEIHSLQSIKGQINYLTIWVGAVSVLFVTYSLISTSVWCCSRRKRREWKTSMETTH